MLTAFIYQDKTLMRDVTRQDLAKAIWSKEALVWVDLEKPTDFEAESLVELFNFHPLAIEDCVNEQSEPKIDDYGDYLFIVVHAANLILSDELGAIELDLFMNRQLLVTYHSKPIACISQVKDMIDRKAGLPMVDGIDVLAHAILDRLVDNYLPVIREHEKRIDRLEDQVFENTDGDFLQRVLKVQKDVLYLKRIIGPQRDMMNHLSKEAESYVQPKRLIYFRDIYDHLFQFYQKAEELDGLLKGILQVYFSHVSTELNQAIKKMTVIATVSLPSVVIASVYGMNFKHMPELEWRHGYYAVMSLMIAISVFLLFWMKRKKWY